MWMVDPRPNVSSKKAAEIFEAWKADFSSLVGRRLPSAWDPVPGVSGTVVIALTVKPNGWVEECWIAEASGQDEIDQKFEAVICGLDMPAVSRALGVRGVKVVQTVHFFSSESDLAKGDHATSPGGDNGFVTATFDMTRLKVPKEEADRLFQAWVEQVRDRVAGEMRYPPQAAIVRVSGTAIIQFTVEADGTARNCTLEHSSGSPSLDSHTLRTVCGMTMPPVPAELGASEIRVRMPQRFEFRM